MSLDPQFVRDLRCPRTRKPVALLDADAVAALNERIRAGGVVDHGGEVVADPIEAALRPDGEDFVYPVRDDIPSMLSDKSLALAVDAARPDASN